ncbi:alpha-tectorin-like [Nerophis ophidion]|uniref:alpha-tectorin-like n=1 Tax=Nerophis ophidion TaxID=159077 RepID=UPI002AE02DF0|nr:alpha-tectorin-like [Nerophis ophidion]
MRCPANSMYSIAAPGCPLTCTSLSSPGECEAPPTEGCVCNPGYFWSQDGCVRLEECGCRFRGGYLESGQSVRPSCQQVCSCQGGVVSCHDTPCSTPVD